MRNAGVPAGAITAETIQLAKEALSNPQPVNGPGLRKAGFNIAEGLEGVNLEAPSKKLFPVYSPLRNKIARIGNLGAQLRRASSHRRLHIGERGAPVKFGITLPQPVQVRAVDEKNQSH